jgi:hypothetical protein
METPVKIRHLQPGIKQILFFIFISSVLTISCKVSWVATYDMMIAQQIENVSKKIDKFYLTMLETTTHEDGQRAYTKFAEQYIDIEVELKSLLQKNNHRAKNQESVQINQKILDKWVEYKGIHKSENNLSDSDIEANKINLDNMMNTFRTAEELKKRIK